MANVASIRQAQLDLLVLGDFTPCGDETSRNRSRVNNR